MLYDINGNIVYNSTSEIFADNMELDYEFDSATNANYTVMRIYKTKTDGTKQYPFVRSKSTSLSALELSEVEDWCVIINASLGPVTGSPYDGIVIENGIAINNSPASYSAHVGAMPLTIDSNGDLSYASADANANTLISNGTVSAICGFCPIIVNYDAVDSSVYNWISHYNQNAQRQIIGQFGNGDYAIITCEGRDYDHSDGWTIAEAISICQKIGLKFAYNLDGGGSTETVIDKKQINTVYEGTKGRQRTGFIVFNGSSTFSIP